MYILTKIYLHIYNFCVIIVISDVILSVNLLTNGVFIMKVSQIKEILDAQVLCCDDLLDTEVCSACGSDMMSDVLAFVKDQSILLTGLVNPQTVRTAMMMDMKGIVFVRGKKPDDSVIALAEESGIIVLSTEYRMYTACGLLYKNGLYAEGTDKV